MGMLHFLRPGWKTIILFIAFLILGFIAGELAYGPSTVRKVDAAAVTKDPVTGQNEVDFPVGKGEDIVLSYFPLPMTLPLKASAEYSKELVDRAMPYALLDIVFWYLAACLVAYAFRSGRGKRSSPSGFLQTS